MSIRVHGIRAVVLLLCFSIVTDCSFAGEEAGGLVTVASGDLPIILTAPHGGSEAVPGVSPRIGEGVDLFQSKSDSFTDELAEKLADAIEARLGKRPYIVIARFHRKYIDANRPPELAYESGQAKLVYDEYHRAIAAARREVINRWGAGILLDLHGQKAEPQTIFRGTQNGKTARSLENRFGRVALTGEQSLFGRLAQQGFHVQPAVNSDEPEDGRYNGGYTVGTYGSALSGAFDAMQLELGFSLRTRDVNGQTADQLATAIAAYGSDFLPREERTPRIRVGVYADVGTGVSVDRLLNVLQNQDGVAVTKLMAADIREGKLNQVDVLIHPGGSGSRQGNQLNAEGRTAIRQWVDQGGGYIGICAGAYLASADYDWSLHLLDAKVLDRKHWNRGNGTVEISVTTAGQELLHIDEDKLQIRYGQGPLLAPANRPDITDYHVLATYETEIAKNGAPQGVMKGTTAIASGEFGQGRVVCFSPHPELTDGLDSLLHFAVEHVTQKSATNPAP